ncbi:MAG: hypothetical protein ABEH90_10950 [Halolamina sp.]
MGLSRRAALPLLLGLSGCTALTNDAVELAVENRSGSEQNVVAYVERADATATATPDPDYEGTIPPGSRVLVPDVVPAPPAGESLTAEADVKTGSYETTQQVTVTGPGTVDVRITRNGIRVFFEAKD